MTSDDEAKAQAIIDSWFWQMSEGHNFRWKNAVKSMTLFYESAPMESDVAQLVLEYLRTRSAVTQLVIGHKKWTFDEPGWNTKDAWYQTAPSEQWAGTESKKVRVYWVLAQAGDDEEDGPYVVENGCKYKVEHSYYWDVAGEPQLPQWSSGVQYSIQGFTRDRETGLYSFIIEKRETVQQDIQLYDSVKTLFEEVSEAQHLGVKQDDVGSTGLAASVGNGERVERHLTKNPDCTTDITNRKVKDKKVEQARTVVRKELRGTSAATTDRNLTTAEVATKTAAAQEIGETRTVEKTDTDLRNLTVEKFTPAATPITLAKSCEKETSVHTDTTVELVQAGAADGSVEQTVEPNKRKTVSVRKNDDGKTADKTTVTQTWTEKTGGGSSNSGNGVVTTTTERKENTTTTPTAAPGVNKVVEIEETPNDHGSKTTVKRVTTYNPEKKSATGGTTSRTVTVESGVNQTSVPTDAPAVNKEVEVSVSLNDHGSMSTQKRVTTYKPEKKSATGGTTSRTVTVESGVNQTDIPKDSPATNKEVEVSVSLNDHGSMTTQKRVTTYKPEMKSATGGTTSRTVTVTSGVNQTDVPNESAAVNKEVDISVSLNDHGSMSTQKRVTTYKPEKKSATGGTTSRTVEVESGVNQTDVPKDSPATNKEVEVSVSLNDHGSMSTQKRVTTYKPEKKKAKGGTTSRTVTVESGVNQTDVPSEGAAVNKEVEVSVSLNDHGSMSTQKRVTEFKPEKKSATGGTTSRTVTVESGVNQTDVPSEAAAVNKEVEVSVSLNDHGSMSTQKRVTQYRPEVAMKTWSDDRYIYTHCAYSNQVQPLTPSAGDITSASFHPNGHGSYDGSWTSRSDKNDDEQGQTLQWSTGPSSVTAKYFYFNKKGKLCSRTVTGSVYRCGGKLPHVAREITTRQAGGWTGFAPCGWNTGVSGSYEHAFGIAYGNINVSSETQEDPDDGSDSGAS